MNTNKIYIQAYNYGYLLAKYNPKLVDVLSQSFISHNPYVEIFMAGKHQYEKENTKDQVIELQKLRETTLGNFRTNDLCD